MPDDMNVGLRRAILSEFSHILHADGKALKKKLAMLITGRAQGPPFEEEVADRLRESVRAAARVRGFEHGPLPGDRPQPVEVRLLGSYLRGCGDPQWRVYGKHFAPGTRIGVGVRLPRTPAVYKPLTDDILLRPKVQSVIDF